MLAVLSRKNRDRPGTPGARIRRRNPIVLIVPLGLAVCLSLLGDLTLYTVLGSQHASVGISLAAVGVMLSANRLIRIPGNPLLGMLLDRLGRRPLFLWGMALGAISTASYGLVRGFWPFLLGRLLWGIAWTLINVGGMTMILDVSTPANRGHLTGMYNTWVLVGLGASQLLGGFLVDQIGFDAAMRWCAGLTALGGLIAFLALPETAPREPADRPGPRGCSWWTRRRSSSCGA